MYDDLRIRNPRTRRTNWRRESLRMPPRASPSSCLFCSGRTGLDLGLLGVENATRNFTVASTYEYVPKVFYSTPAINLEEKWNEKGQQHQAVRRMTVE